MNTSKSWKPRKSKLPVLFILFCMVPSIVLTVTFIIIPTVQAILLSFQEVGVLSMKGEFIALEHYKYLFKDHYFTQALTNTLKVMLVVPVCVISTAFILACILQQVKLKEKELYISIYYLPSTISSTVIAIVWSYVFHPTSGSLNKLLEVVGLESLQRTWLGDSSTALWCIAMVIYVSCFGHYLLLHRAGLEGISPEIYESATIDGAGFWTKFTKITFPLMKNIIGITFILNMSGVLSASYTYSMIMTNGGPNGASNVLLRYIYQQGMLNGNMGYSSAITVATLILAIALSLISRMLTSKSEV